MVMIQLEETRGKCLLCGCKAAEDQTSAYELMLRRRDTEVRLIEEMEVPFPPWPWLVEVAGGGSLCGLQKERGPSAIEGWLLASARICPPRQSRLTL